MKAILWRIWSNSNNPTITGQSVKIFWNFYILQDDHSYYKWWKGKKFGKCFRKLTYCCHSYHRYIYLWTLQDYCFTLAWQKDRLMIFILIVDNKIYYPVIEIQACFMLTAIISLSWYLLYFSVTYFLLSREATLELALSVRSGY